MTSRIVAVMYIVARWTDIAQGLLHVQLSTWECVCLVGGGGHVFPGEVKEGSTRGIELGLSGRAQHEGWGLGTVLQGILLTH